MISMGCTKLKMCQVRYRWPDSAAPSEASSWHERCEESVECARDFEIDTIRFVILN